MSSDSSAVEARAAGKAAQISAANATERKDASPLSAATSGHVDEQELIDLLGGASIACQSESFQSSATAISTPSTCATDEAATSSVAASPLCDTRSAAASTALRSGSPRPDGSLAPAERSTTACARQHDAVASNRLAALLAAAELIERAEHVTAVAASEATGISLLPAMCGKAAADNV
jgi:hypothetical protein